MVEVDDVLEAVFGIRSDSASDVTPSALDADRSEEVAELLDYEQVVRQAGILAAQAVADGLESAGLRPADYCSLLRLRELVLERLVKAMPEYAEGFMDAFSQQMRMRG